MSDPSTLAESAWVRFEDIIQRFEEAWREGARPDIDDFLSSHGSTDRRVLLELVHIDLEFRLRAEEDARAEEYLKRYPQLRNDATTAIELITAEFALRRRWRSGAKLEDFVKRFPEFEKELTIRLNAVETLGHARRTPQIGIGPTDLPQLPGFAIQKEVGRGGMGIVYRALDLRLNRVVALKTLAGGIYSAPSERERFCHEAEAIAHLDHPNIVPVYEVGDSDGLPFFSMKYFAGGSLAQHDRGKNTDPMKIADLVRVVAGAVHHAHQRGILHRDLKPSNILLDEEGRPHVTDFGLAKRFDPKAGMLDASTIAGTPAYMAPEQAAGKGDLTTATDVYGLGAILYELLTGSKPFSGDSPLTILQQLSEVPPTRPTAHNPRLPRDLETITLKCLEKNPQRRYSSAQDLADDIERWQSGESIHARPVSAWERSWRTVRRHPVVSGLILATTSAMIFATVTLTISRDRIREALAQERQATVDLSQALEREREHLYHERVTSAWRMWSSNYPDRAEALLELCPPRFRRYEWFLLDKVRKQDKFDVPLASKGRPHAAVFSPCGKYLVTGDMRGIVGLHDPHDGRLIKTFTGENFSAGSITFDQKGELLAAVVGKSAFVWRLSDGEKIFQQPATRWAALSPDGQTLAAALEKTVVIYDVKNGNLVHKLESHSDLVICGGFNQDGLLATGSADRTVRIWNCKTGDEAYPAKSMGQSVFALVWVPNENHIVVGQFKELHVIDPKTSQIVERIFDTERAQTGLAITNDGRQLAYVSDNGTIRVRDMENGEEFQSLRGHQSQITSLSFNPAGDRLAAIGSAGPAKVWTVGVPSEGRLLAMTNSVRSMSFSSDGKKLAYARFMAPLTNDTEAGKVLVIDPQNGKQLLNLSGHHDVVFGPGDQWLATLRSDNSISGYDVNTGKELWKVSEPTFRNSRLAVSKDGRLASGTSEGAVLIWDKAGEGQAKVLRQHPGGISGICFSSDGEYLATSSRNGLLVIWNRAGEVVRRFNYGNAIQAIAFSPDGKLLAVGGSNRVIRTWNVGTGEEAMAYHGHINQILSLAFSPDGRRLISGGLDSTARLWDVSSGREIMQLPGVRGVVNGVAFSPNNLNIVTSALGLKIWETDDGPHCP